jgi:hypothetical protein
LIYAMEVLDLNKYLASNNKLETIYGNAYSFASEDR